MLGWTQVTIRLPESVILLHIVIINSNSDDVVDGARGDGVGGNDDVAQLKERLAR
jgi:hypothetical protein